MYLGHFSILLVVWIVIRLAPVGEWGEETDDISD